MTADVFRTSRERGDFGTFHPKIAKPRPAAAGHSKSEIMTVVLVIGVVVGILLGLFWNVFALCLAVIGFCGLIFGATIVNELGWSIASITALAIDTVLSTGYLCGVSLRLCVESLK